MLPIHVPFRQWEVTFQKQSTNFLDRPRKAIDDNDPVSPAGPPQGYGGVGIFYRSNWSLDVIELLDGGNRVCVIEVQAENLILVICAYLPSRKYLKKDSSSGDPIEFMSTLDQLQDIIQAYENTNTILLCGDMNSSLLKRHGNPQDQMLHDFVLQLENFVFSLRRNSNFFPR